MFRLPVFLVLQYIHNISSNAFHIFPLECTLCFPASDFNNSIMQYIIPFLTIYLYIHYAKFVLYSLHCNQYVIVCIYVICTKYNTIHLKFVQCRYFYYSTYHKYCIPENISPKKLLLSLSRGTEPSSYIDTVHTTNDNNIFFDA